MVIYTQPQAPGVMTHAPLGGGGSEGVTFHSSGDQIKVMSTATEATDVPKSRAKAASLSAQQSATVQSTCPKQPAGKRLQGRTMETSFWESKHGKILWLVVLPLGLYIIDISTDIGLAFQFYNSGQMVWFGWMMGFIVVPSAIINITLTEEAFKHHDGENRLSKNFKYLLNYLRLGVFVQYYNLYRRLQRGESVEDIVKKDLPLTHLLEAVFSNMPQLYLQWYIILNTTEQISALQVATMFRASKLAQTHISSSDSDLQRYLTQQTDICGVKRHKSPAATTKSEIPSATAAMLDTPQARRPQARHPQVRHLQARHPQVHHPNTRHHQARRPTTRHPKPAVPLPATPKPATPLPATPSSPPPSPPSHYPPPPSPPSHYPPPPGPPHHYPPPPSPPPHYWPPPSPPPPSPPPQVRHPQLSADLATAVGLKFDYSSQVGRRTGYQDLLECRADLQ
uniref:XK-related protein n=1 Tax=Branchiostoma floridae TaxID=7739 RepID=C3ZWW5_BRAFL|eukprot:XP_002586965.1 hypothetical protein BRAFLDRAFT_99324 [Branchiostoma floridae]